MVSLSRLFAAAAVGVLLFATPARAQSVITFAAPVEGSVTAGGSQSWTFHAESGAVVSVLAEALSSELDPVITLIDQTGRALYTNDDYDYPNSRDARLEAVTLPRTETYTVTLSAFANTAGEFRLTLLPGYSALVNHVDSFGDGWSGTGDLRVTGGDEVLTLALEGIRDVDAAYHSEVMSPANLYAQVDVLDVNNPQGWSVGLAARGAGDSAYLFEVNSQGMWRFSIRQGDAQTVLRDWIPHPTIVPGLTEFTVGLIANDVGFDFFYNLAYIGSVTDATLIDPGQVGIIVGTIGSLSGVTAAQYDNLIVTAPFEVNQQRLIPGQIPGGEGTAIALALKRQAMIAPDGVMALTIPDSSVEYVRPGVNRVMLGRGTTYTQFALGATVDMAPSAQGIAGCGLVFHFVGETSYSLAYIDQTGGYGLSHREGETFAPGLFGELPSLRAGRHHLLVIAHANTLYYYIDRQFVGALDNPAQDGQIGIAVVNFEGNSTACRYSNLWLWEWE
jgi:hypothetical protein